MPKLNKLKDGNYFVTEEFNKIIDELDNNFEELIQKIIENGSGIVDYVADDNGYVRFENGFQIAWKYLYPNDLGGTLWDTSTQIWYSNLDFGNWNVPFSFILFATYSIRSTTYWPSGSGWTATSAGTMRAFRPNDNVGSAQCYVFGIGFWK